LETKRGEEIMADYSNIFKVWGLRKRILLTDTTEIDFLTLKKDCFCSTHNHEYKINKFVVVEGQIRIESEYGEVVLNPGDEFEVRPPLVHRFYAVEDSTMIELAYVEEGKIDPKDIHRISQGGRIVKDKEMTLDEMRKKKLFPLS
jgi:quercetin dioxygenase-like cupin family protein